MIGALPFALAALYPFINGGLCRDVTAVSEVFCSTALLRADSALHQSFWSFYLVCFLFAFISAIFLKRAYLVLLLAPLALSAFISFHGLSPASLAVDHSNSSMSLSDEIKVARAQNVLLKIDKATLQSEVYKLEEDVATHRTAIELHHAKINEWKSSIASATTQITNLKPSEIYWGPSITRRGGERIIENDGEGTVIKHDQDEIDNLKSNITIWNQSIDMESLKIEAENSNISEILTQISQVAQKPRVEKKGININTLWLSYSILALVTLCAAFIAMPLYAVPSLFFLSGLTGFTYLSAPELQILSTAGGSGFFEFVSTVVIALYPVIVFLLIALIVRFVAVGYFHNSDLFALLTPTQSRAAFVKTFARWAGVLAFGVLGIWMTQTFDGIARDAVYDLGIDEVECTDPKNCGVVLDYPQGKTLESDIHLSIETHFEGAKPGLNAALTDTNSNAKNIAAQSEAEAMGLLYDDPVKPLIKKKLSDYSPSLEPPSCKWYEVFCAVKRSGLKAANRSYEKSRASQRDSTKQFLGDQRADVQLSADQKTKLVQDHLHEGVDAAKNGVKKSVSSMYFTIRLLNLVSAFIFITALVKSFLYIFARFAFHPHNGHVIRMVKESNAPEMSTWLGSKEGLGEPSTGSKLELNGVSSSDLFFRRGRDVTGTAATISLPRPFNAIFRRLINGLYLVNRVTVEQLEKCSVQDCNGRQFVSLKLMEREIVYVKASSLIAFSSEVTLRTKFSLRISSIIFGRMFFLTARGPGTLIFVTEGAATAELADTPARTPDRMLAWSAEGEFSVVSDPSWLNIYLSGTSIAVLNKGKLISQDGSRSGLAGAVRYIPSLLLPI